MERTGLITFVGFWAVVAGGLAAIASGPSVEKGALVAAQARTQAAPLASAQETAPASSASAANAAPSGSASSGSLDEAAPVPDLAAAAPAAASGKPSLTQLGDAPKSVRFGAVIVRHRGAQATSPKARTPEEALKKAQKLQQIAQDDFKEAVKQGDPGSVENAGKMFRGILEPSVEVALFRLKKGEVSRVVRTPRGFLIFRRR